MVIGRRSLLLAGVAVPAAAVSARAECVTDSPAVDACRGGVRTTVPFGATLDLSFGPPALDPRITFTRASTATYFDSSGVIQTAATNAPRFDYDPVTHAALGLLIEDTRTNVLLNSAALGTQSVAVTAQAYTLSFYGTGTVTKSGTAAGALVGTGAFPTRASQTFTPTAGTLTLTVTGSVLNAQLEAGAFATSYIATTGAAATRAIDSCAILPANTGWFVPPGGSWMAELIPMVLASCRVIFVTQGSPGTITPIVISSGAGGQYDVTFLGTVNTTTLSAVARIASTYVSLSGSVCLNGGPVASGALTGGYGIAATQGLGFFCAPPGGTDNTSGYLRRVRYWPRVLSAAEMQSVTR